MIAGVVLRKERRLGEILTDSFNILFAHWSRLFVITVPLVVANVALSLVFLALTPDFATADEISAGADVISEDDIGQLALLVLIGLASIPLFLVLYQLVGGAGVIYLDEVDKGRSPAPADALDRAQEKLAVLIKAALRAYAIVFLLSITIVGIPWAINRGIRWIFLIQVVTLEDRRGEVVLEASSALVKGRWWNTLGRLIVTGLVIGIPVNLLAQAIASALPGVLGAILSASTVFITATYGIISISLMYFDLKERKSTDDNFSTPREPSAEPGAPGQGA